MAATYTRSCESPKTDDIQNPPFLLGIYPHRKLASPGMEKRSIGDQAGIDHIKPKPACRSEQGRRRERTKSARTPVNGHVSTVLAAALNAPGAQDVTLCGRLCCEAPGIHVERANPQADEGCRVSAESHETNRRQKPGRDCGAEPPAL